MPKHEPQTTERGKHLVDFVYMIPPEGGRAKKIDLDANDEHQISRLMFAGWTQAASRDERIEKVEPLAEPTTERKE